MANTYENLAVDNNVGTDAEWQAWCQAVEAAIIASGFLEVAPDTGQLNLATTTRPSVGTYAGFRIYRAKDALAATKPVYVKIEYGNTGSGQDRVIIRRTIGTGSNGAGTLTGPTTAAVASANSSAGSGAAQIYGGGGSSAVFFYQVDPGSGSHNIFWFLGRLRDTADGSSSNELIMDVMQSAAGFTIASFNWTDHSAAWVAQGGTGLGLHYVGDLTGSVHTGGNINFTRVFQGAIYRNGKTLTPPLVLGKASELPFTTTVDSKFTIPIWGGSHTFLPIAQIGPNGNRPCFLWE